jgi:D-alanyl-D-alanine carboxypeptidase
MVVLKANHIMTRKLTLLSIIVLLFFAKISPAQTFNKAKMDSLFDALEINNKAMLSIAITQKGVPLYSRAIGYSWYNSTVKTHATTKTKYRIGSISKMFTAVMIFQLIEEGKLQLTTPLSKYYPTVPNAAQITIAQMLNHSSGIHSFTADTGYTSWLTQKVTPAILLAKMMKPILSRAQSMNIATVTLCYWVIL